MPGTHHSKARWLHLQHRRPPQTCQGPVELTPQSCGVFGCALMNAHRTFRMPDTTGFGHEGGRGTAWAPPWVGGADADGADTDRATTAGHKETAPFLLQKPRDKGTENRAWPWHSRHPCPMVQHRKPSPVGVTIPRSPFGDTPGMTTQPASPAPHAVFAAPAGCQCAAPALGDMGGTQTMTSAPLGPLLGPEAAQPQLGLSYPKMWSQP